MKFTDAQAAHANKVLTKLIKLHRFFLYNPDDDRKLDPDGFYVLDRNIFGDVWDLNNDIRQIYPSVKVEAEEQIRTAEADLGLVQPDLTNNKQLVQCNRHTGGLDICQVIPLAQMSKHILSRQTISSRLFTQFMGKNSEDDLAPKQVNSYRATADAIARTVIHELDSMDVNRTSIHTNNKCVVLLRTRFHLSSGDDKYDLMYGKVANFPQFPYGLGYLLYEYSQHHRIVGNNYILTSTSLKSHVHVRHWNNKDATVHFDENNGYSCPVFFATVL